MRWRFLGMVALFAASGAAAAAEENMLPIGRLRRAKAGARYEQSELDRSAIYMNTLPTPEAGAAPLRQQDDDLPCRSIIKLSASGLKTFANRSSASRPRCIRHRNASPSAKSARRSYSLRCRPFGPTCPLTCHITIAGIDL
jgi:hypothetical protein